MTTEIFEHNGKKYRLADERDIGKEVYRSETDFYTAMKNGLAPMPLEGYCRNSFSPYETAFSHWRFAYVELEPEVAAESKAESPRPDWLPEGARILGDDEVIEYGDQYCDDYGDIANATMSIGMTHKAAKAEFDMEWLWFRPALPTPTTTEPEQPAEVPKEPETIDYKGFEERINLSLAASRYLAACREHTRAIEELSNASQDMQGLLKNGLANSLLKTVTTSNITCSRSTSTVHSRQKWLICFRSTA